MLLDGEEYGNWTFCVLFIPECWILYKGDKGKLSESIRQAVENFNIRHKAEMSKKSKGKTNLEMWRNYEMPNIKLISMNTAIEASDVSEDTNVLNVFRYVREKVTRNYAIYFLKLLLHYQVFYNR